MIYIYREAGSNGARDLADELQNGARLRRTTGRRRLTANDQIICWGQQFPNAPGRTLNNVAPRSKYTQAELLRRAGIRTIQTSRTRPLQVHDQVWIPRTNDHQGGNDLRNPPRNPDFWVLRENIVREFRVHSFLGRSIRGVVKVPREGFRNPSEWIRSWDSGWRMIWQEGAIRQRHRDIAAQAVRALGLDFGAVDIGELSNGELIVLEVNSAPGIEGSTLEAYANAIEGWVAGSITPREIPSDDVNQRPRRRRERRR
jgi:hypothetical protein